MQASTVVYKKKPRRFRRFVLILLALLLLIAGAGATFLFATQPTGVRHYLLVGKDSWEGLTPSEKGRTDVMMLVTLDFEANRILLTSFLRDTLVRMPKGNQNRLNTIAQWYGDDALRKYLEDTYNIRIDGMFCLNFWGAIRVVDALGGVTVDLTRAEVAYLRRTFPAPKYTLYDGLCKLSGAQALEYMRCRKLDNDFGRTNRQSNVMKALMQEMSGVSLEKALLLVPELGGFFTTDLSLTEQLALTRDAYTLRNARVDHHQVPASGTFSFSKLGSMSVLKIDQEKNKQLLEAFWTGR